MKTKLALAITSALALTACVDDYELSSEGDNFHSVGTVEVTGDTTTGETLTATITDYDGFSADAVTYTWYKDNAPSSNTGSTYVLTDADIDSVFSVKVEYVDNAGYNEVAISEFSDVVEEIAVQSGGSAVIEGDVWVDGVIEAVITDENGFGDNDITYQWMAGGVNIGEALVGTDGEKIKLTEDEKGEIITVQITYIDNDGFEESFISADSITTVTDKPASVIETKVVAITDSFTDNAGQFRIKLTDSGTGDIDGPAGEEFLKTGKLSVTFQKDEVLSNDATPVAKDAYIVLYGSSTSTDDAIVDLKISNTGYAIREWARNSDGSIELDSEGKKVKSDVLLAAPSYTPETWVKADIVWDATDADLTVGPTVTVYIDDQKVYSATSTSDAYSTFNEGVQTVQFKLGDKSSTSDDSFRVDDLKIYSDIDGTTIAWQDDFEALVEGESVVKGDNTGGSEYNNNSFGAFIEQATITIEDDTSGGSGGSDDDNLYAATLVDTLTTKDAEFTIFTNDTLTIDKGRLEMSFYKPKVATGIEDSQQKDAYIGVYTAGTSNSNALIDLRLHGVFPDDGGLPEEGDTVVDYGTFEQRNGSGLELDPAVILKATDSAIVGEGKEYNQGVHYEVGEWQDIEISWDATSETETAIITVVFNGETYTFDSATDQGADIDAFANLNIRFSDSSRTLADTVNFQIDDIKVYAIDPTTGEEVLKIDENFESDVEGTAPTGGVKVDQTTVEARRL